MQDDALAVGGDVDAVEQCDRKQGVLARIVWTVNVDSGRQTQVTNFTSMIGWVRTASWSPDGKRISEPRVAQ